jgi:hypothetical protein
VEGAAGEPQQRSSAVDPDHFDPDPVFHFDTDPTILYRSGSLLLRGNVPLTRHFIHLDLILLVSRSARTQPAGVH